MVNKNWRAQKFFVDAPRADVAPCRACMQRVGGTMLHTVANLIARKPGA